jgi:hypothetical protein
LPLWSVTILAQLKRLRRSQLNDKKTIESALPQIADTQVTIGAAGLGALTGFLGEYELSWGDQRQVFPLEEKGRDRKVCQRLGEVTRPAPK